MNMIDTVRHALARQETARDAIRTHCIFGLGLESWWKLPISEHEINWCQINWCQFYFREINSGNKLVSVLFPGRNLN